MSRGTLVPSMQCQRLSLSPADWSVNRNQRHVRQDETTDRFRLHFLVECAIDFWNQIFSYMPIVYDAAYRGSISWIHHIHSVGSAFSLVKSSLFSIRQFSRWRLWGIISCKHSPIITKDPISIDVMGDPSLAFFDTDSMRVLFKRLQFSTEKAYTW